MGEAKSQNIIKLTQLLVSLSLCSFLFSPSSLLGFVHYFNLYFSSFPFQLFSHTIDKNCMFILCNGLLVFVGITRSFSGSSPDLDETSKHNIQNGSQSQFSEVEANEKESEVKISEVAEEVEQEDIEMATGEDEEQKEEELIGSGQLGFKEEEEEADEETGILEGGDDEEEGLMSENNEFLIEETVEEEKDVVEEENWRLTTEEMNKKFDDFIRRMKEDLRIEAQRQLVMV